MFLILKHLGAQSINEKNMQYVYICKCIFFKMKRHTIYLLSFRSGYRVYGIGFK